MPKHRKKLIEVDLPLADINKESKREKNIRHGHPSTLHLWWARRPLASCRAVIFASMVDDPSSCPDEFPTIEDQIIERKRLRGIISRLVKWEYSNDPDLLAQARLEIAKSIARQPNKPPIPGYTTQPYPLSLDGDLCKTQWNSDSLLRFSILQVGFSYSFPPTRERR